MYFWLSTLISDWSIDEWHWVNTDDRDNERGVPPADERVAWHGVWVAEAYLPSSVHGLTAGIEKLGWWESHRGETAANRIRSGRSGHGGGWVNLPFLRRRTSRRVLGVTSYERDLPEGVEYLSGQIHFLTPSLTVLIAGFASISLSPTRLIRRCVRGTGPSTLRWEATQGRSTRQTSSDVMLSELWSVLGLGSVATGSRLTCRGTSRVRDRGRSSLRPS